MNKLGLYIHIPFCRQKCQYCAFYSSRPRPQDISRYVKAVVRQLDSYDEDLQDYHIDTVYFGGGTPSLLSEGDMAQLMDAIRRYPLSEHAEITCECNPDSATENKLLSYASLGINRISIGMQSGQQDELRALGRLHPHEKTAACVAACKQAGIENISLDLLLSIPHQTPDSLMDSLQKAVDLHPAHLSVYGLKIEEKTPFFLDPPPMPDEDTEWEAYQNTFAFLESMGYNQYEISNAAKPGFESRHNNKYWKRDETLGLGPAAHSFFKGRRFYQEADTAAFMQGNKNIVQEPPLTARDILEETVMLGLRLKEGVDVTPLSPSPQTISFLEQLEKEAYCTYHKGVLSLTRKGFFLSNTIITSLLNLI